MTFSPPQTSPHAVSEKKKRTPKQISCIQCMAGKRHCGKEQPACARCVSLEKACEYRPSKRLPKEARAQLEVIPSAKTMVYDDDLQEEVFVSMCLDMFDKTMGVLFNYQDRMAGAPLSSLYTSRARSARTDAALACACRGMGWVSRAKMYQQRASSHVPILLADRSEETFWALSCLVLLSSGGEQTRTKILLGHCAKIKEPTFEIDTGKPLSHFKRKALLYTNHAVDYESKQIVTAACKKIFSPARNVRHALNEKLDPADILSLGPWDYADFKERDEGLAEVDDEIARGVLLEIDEMNERLEKMWEPLEPDVRKIITQKHLITTHAVRGVLHFQLGDHDEAKRRVQAALSCFNSFSAAMWYFASFTHLVHCLDVSIGMRDLFLFEQGMVILRRMAPMFPIAEKLSFALSDVWSLFAAEVNCPDKRLCIEASPSSSIGVAEDSWSDLETMLEDALDHAESKGEFDCWLQACEAAA